MQVALLFSAYHFSGIIVKLLKLIYITGKTCIMEAL